MKVTTLAVFAALILIANPPLGARIECATASQSAAGRAGLHGDDALLLDEELILKRKKTREAGLARARKQLERARSHSATAPAAPSGPVERN